MYPQKNLKIIKKLYNAKNKMTRIIYYVEHIKNIFKYYLILVYKK